MPECPFVPKSTKLICVKCGDTNVNLTGSEVRLSLSEIVAFGLKAIGAVFCYCDRCGHTIAIQEEK